MMIAMAGGFVVVAGAGVLMAFQDHKVGAGLLLAVGLLIGIALSATRGVTLRGPYFEGWLIGLPFLIAGTWWQGRRRAATRRAR